METYKIGLSGIHGKITLDDTYLEMKNFIGVTLFRVPIKEVKTVVTAKSSFLKSFIKVMGAGTELGSAELTAPEAAKVQEWINARLKN